MSTFSVLVCLIIVLISVVNNAAADGNFTIPFVYPLFKQCTDAWGTDLMTTKTICSVGCLMSSTSMGLSGTGSGRI